MGALGELEQLILLAVLRLGGETYGVPVRDEIHARTGRNLTRGAIYTSLARLERKGLLLTNLGEATPVRGGKRKRYYRLSEAGLDSLRESLRAVRAMKTGVDDALREVP